MNKYLDLIKTKIKESKRKIIKGSLILVSLTAAIGIAGAVSLYNITKSNINYTVEQAQEIALLSVPGEVVRVHKDYDLDNLSYEYEFKIKDANNRLVEVTVDSNIGAITDIDR